MATKFSFGRWTMQLDGDGKGPEILLCINLR